jgi:hypothetical protein
MTWAQNTFALCFLFLVPAMGFLLAGRFRQQGRSRFQGFVNGTFLGGMTFIGCCVLAKLCFPRYPHERISEWIANAFTLPLLGTGLLLAWFFPRIDSTQKQFSRRWSCILGVLYLGCVGLGFRGTLWGFRTALPWSASEIHDCGDWSVMPADGVYWLKARITRCGVRCLHRRARTQALYPGSASIRGRVGWEKGPRTPQPWIHPGLATRRGNAARR